MMIHVRASVVHTEAEAFHLGRPVNALSKYTSSPRPLTLPPKLDSLYRYHSLSPHIIKLIVFNSIL